MECNRTLAALVIINKSKYGEVLLSGGSCTNVKLIMDCLRRSGFYIAFITRVALDDWCTSKYYREVGMDFCGTLEKELKSGDVNIYIY